MEFLQNSVLKDKDFSEKYVNHYKTIKQECENYFKEIDVFLKTKNADYFKPLNSEKENVEPNKRKGRLRRPPLANITEDNLSETQTVTIKKEKISDVQDKQDIYSLNVEVKKEIEEMPAPTKIPPRKKKIKAEKIELPKRSTRSRAKQQENETASQDDITKSGKGSDVIIQNTTITTIDISDSEKEIETENEAEKIQNQTEMRSTRSKLRKQNKHEFDNPIRKSLRTEFEEERNQSSRTTRTKTKQKKRARSGSVEQPCQPIENKKSKSNSHEEKEVDSSHQTEYEDAVSVLDNNEGKQQAVDATYIASCKISNGEETVGAGINSTIVVENPKMVTQHTEDLKSQSDILKAQKTPPKHKNKKATKQIFSPFEKTPVKKKVEAFEKLGVDSSGIPTRTTRTKKKTEKKDIEHKEDSESKHDGIKKSFEKHNLKTLTPLASKFVPKLCSTSKINKLHPTYSTDTSTSNESILSAKSASALKASQAEFREREKRRQEKEKEALRKREALLQAQTEEKRRKREEKQQKAQQQREILEKEKLKHLELQRIKEEKYKQVMAEREEKLTKQREEAEKKRLMAKKKANDLLKEKGEMIKVAEQKKVAEMKAILDKQGDMTKMTLKQKMEAQQKSIPVYMITKPPLLPTAQCYDSDEPEYESTHKIEPIWSRDTQNREMQIAMITAGETIKNSFFCRQAQTPDLQEIFEIIDPRKLKRTSSAIWRKPPRYTLMPTLEDTLEFSDDDSD